MDPIHPPVDKKLKPTDLNYFGTAQANMLHIYSPSHFNDAAMQYYQQNRNEGMYGALQHNTIASQQGADSPYLSDLQKLENLRLHQMKERD